ncbi:MAG: 16S rRNA (adenine(1518)-N(6)/adenine(1519)-N(6))-dimethyltransferase RsmA [Candidatus Paceibacterota bacterium]|jgi:16S rRNA (adenine1518-N6/adenine1519-N6)-dimethyltransferase
MYKAKKSLGQNFLKSTLALNKIIEAGEISPNDFILEIGPGKGALTEKLLEKSGKVIAVEKDRELFEFLKIKFKKEIKANTLILVCEDILKISPTQTLPKGKGYKIIANIPYNITGAILKKFLTEKNQPSLMVLMVQNEVAKRIVARDKKESILSISVKAYGEPKYILKVPARYFSPIPKVDSAAIVIKNISRKNFLPLLNKERAGVRFLNSPPLNLPLVKEEEFWEIVRSGFAHKRKKLSSNLKLIKNLINLEKTKNLGNKRAEELSLKDWLDLAKN